MEAYLWILIGILFVSLILLHLRVSHLIDKIGDMGWKIVGICGDLEAKRSELAHLGKTNGILVEQIGVAKNLLASIHDRLDTVVSNNVERDRTIDLLKIDLQPWKVNKDSIFQRITFLEDRAKEIAKAAWSEE